MKARDIYALAETFKNWIQNNHLSQLTKETSSSAVFQTELSPLSREAQTSLNLKNLNINDAESKKILEALRLMTDCNFDSRFKGLELLKEISTAPFFI
jgi:hypothetical protein